MRWLSSVGWRDDAVFGDAVLTQGQPFLCLSRPPPAKRNHGLLDELNGPDTLRFGPHCDWRGTPGPAHGTLDGDASRVEVHSRTGSAASRPGQRRSAIGRQLRVGDQRRGRISAPYRFESLAGVEGLEPPTDGFGDRCSTN